MKVLFLGAGASMPAGYPSASELLPAVTAEAGRSRVVHSNDAFSHWKKVTEDADSLGLDRQILGCPNPEIPLSYLDLWVQAAEEAPRHWFREAIRVGHGNETDLDKWRSERTLRAKKARQAIQTMLADYFGYRSYLDRHPENQSKRDYLRPLLAGLALGDVVITLNWDTTVERTLAEAGRWSPTDGYGLPRAAARLDRQVGGDGHTQPQARSEIKVLKLHGSVGWKRDEFVPDRIFLSNAYLLQDLPVVVDGVSWIYVERGYETHHRPMGPTEPLEALDDALEVPSYLKQVPRGADMRSIWSKASTAIARANEVEVWGYGLPESDGEVRVLLSVLNRRLRHGQVSVIVHNPDEEARRRWGEALGAKAKIDGVKLGRDP